MRRTIFLAVACLLACTFTTIPAPAAIVIHPKNANSSTTDPDPAKVSSALTEFKNLSHKERKDRIKEAKKAVRQYKAEKKAGSEPSTNTLLLVILSILLPPLAVYLHEGQINGKFWLDLILTLIFWIPGVVYALIVVLSKQ